MSIGRAIGPWLASCMGSDKPELLAARSRALSQSVPVLYFLLALNSVLIAWSFVGRAPQFLTIVVPALLCLACFGRAIIWFNRRSRPRPSVEAMSRSIRNTAMLSMLITALFISWSLGLYAYGDELMRLHVAFYVVVTVLGCVLCLIHLPRSAIAVLVIAIAPLSAVLLASGNSTLVSVAVNALFIDGAIVLMVLTYARNFQAMIMSQLKAEAQSSEVARLHARTAEIEDQRRRDRDADLARIAVAFTHSIEGVTAALGNVAVHNGRQSRDVAACSEVALGSLAHVTSAANGAERALASVAAATASLFEAIEAIKQRTAQAAMISTTIESRSDSADQAMAALDATVGRIDKISGMIKTIAGQIDLIALNATIEAARAGSAGRGFAVVANEIKILAAQTAKATDDIGRHLVDVKLASQAANSSVGAMKEAFFDLRSVSEDIADALAIQTNATDGIRGFVGTAVEEASVMRANLAEMSGSAERTHTSARAMLDQCDVLGTETDVLQREVQNFLGFIKAA